LPAIIQKQNINGHIQTDRKRNVVEKQLSYCRL